MAPTESGILTWDIAQKFGPGINRSVDTGGAVRRPREAARNRFPRRGGRRAGPPGERSPGPGRGFPQPRDRCANPGTASTITRPLVPLRRAGNDPRDRSAFPILPHRKRSVNRVYPCYGTLRGRSCQPHRPEQSGPAAARGGRCVNPVAAARPAPGPAGRRTARPPVCPPRPDPRPAGSRTRHPARSPATARRRQRRSGPRPWPAVLSRWSRGHRSGPAPIPADHRRSGPGAHRPPHGLSQRAGQRAAARNLTFLREFRKAEAARNRTPRGNGGGPEPVPEPVSNHANTGSAGRSTRVTLDSTPQPDKGQRRNPESPSPLQILH